jgi:hypothetical protein
MPQSIGFRPAAVTRTRISPLAGVRLGDVPDFQDFGAAEPFVDDGATHVDLQLCFLMGLSAITIRRHSRAMV